MELSRRNLTGWWVALAHRSERFMKKPEHARFSVWTSKTAKNAKTAFGRPLRHRDASGTITCIKLII